jgi:hypothetical protein
MELFSTVEPLDDTFAAELLTPGERLRKAVAAGQARIRQSLVRRERVRAVAADEGAAAHIVVVTNQRLLIMRKDGRAVLSTIDAATLSSVFLRGGPGAGRTAELGGTGYEVHFRAPATAQRFQSIVHDVIIARRPRAVPVLHPQYFTDLLARARVPHTPVNLARLIERTALMTGCQAAAYCAKLADPAAFRQFTGAFARAEASRDPQLVDQMVDWLWAWNPGCHADLTTRFDTWTRGLLGPDSFLVPGREIAPFFEGRSDFTESWTVVFRKNSR